MKCNYFAKFLNFIFKVFYLTAPFAELIAKNN